MSYCYLKAVDLGVWRVTRDGMKLLKNPDDKPSTNDKKEIHLSSRARNCLFESISVDVFNQVFMLTKANEI